MAEATHPGEREETPMFAACGPRLVSRVGVAMENQDSMNRNPKVSMNVVLEWPLILHLMSSVHLSGHPGPCLECVHTK